MNELNIARQIILAERTVLQMMVIAERVLERHRTNERQIALVGDGNEGVRGSGSLRRAKGGHSTHEGGQS